MGSIFKSIFKVSALWGTVPLKRQNIKLLPPKPLQKEAPPAGGEGHAQHPDALGLGLGHQVFVVLLLLRLLVRPVRRHLQAVVQLPAAGLGAATRITTPPQHRHYTPSLHHHYTVGSTHITAPRRTRASLHRHHTVGSTHITALRRTHASLNASLHAHYTRHYTVTTPSLHRH